MFFVFSADMHTFFYYNEGMFIDGFQSTAEMDTFVFGKDRNDHISGFFGVATARFPPGRIPVEFIYDVIKDGFRFFFCIDHDFCIDVLCMCFVGHQGADGGIDNAVYGCRNTKKDRADSVDDRIDGQRDLSYAEIFVFLGKKHADDIHTTAGTAGAQGDTDARTGEKSAHDAGSQAVIDQGCSRYWKYT